MAKTYLAVAVASNLIAALLAEWPVNLLVAAGGVAGFALVEHLSRAAGRGLSGAERPARGGRLKHPGRPCPSRDDASPRGPHRA
jgi:hypothetical protein